MTEKPTRSGQNRRTSADVSAEESGWVTTDVAAAVLEVSPRTVHRFIEHGKLVGRTQEEGIAKVWFVSIDSLQTLKNQRTARGHVRHTSPDTSSIPESMTDTMKWLTARLEAKTAEAAEMKARLELIEQAESTLWEERERLLAELERSHDQHRQELEREREQHQAELEHEREERQRALEMVRRLREELESEQDKGFFGRLLGG